MLMRRQTNPDGSIDYPDSDGQPMSDNTVQFRWIVTIEGGLDTVDGIVGRKDLPFIFQQFPYDDNGTVEDIEHTRPRFWATLNRESTINGQLHPVIQMTPGEVQRWRFIHAGIAELLDLSLKDAAETQQ